LLDNCQVVFIRKKDLTKFLRENTSICMQVVCMLSQDLHGAYERVRTIGTMRNRHPRIVFHRRAMVV
jgi:hypothetical protein